MPERGPSRDLERLLAFGIPAGPEVDEALALFARLRATPEEGRAVEGLLGRAGQSALPDPLLVALSTALLDRGDEAGAARLLARATSNPALLMRAELRARAGDLRGAMLLAEQVLARDLAWPGARERHARWRDQLGLPRVAHAENASETVAAGPPDAPYDLLREVGRGGAGVVYEARDRRLGRPAALKVYHQPESTRPQLLHEARVAVALAGEGIVRVFDVDPGRGWLAMEWAGLGALRARLRSRDAASLLPMARWALPLARALARVHAAGWVHHDVKPANILLAGPGAPLLSDFGTARRVGEPSPPGSLGYLSPERLAGRPSDPRDDVYAFGRVLEDALRSLGDTDETPVARSLWRAMAGTCTGPDADRPANGEELLRLLGTAAGAPRGS